jgi:exodeoxyribonuclease VIII
MNSKWTVEEYFEDDTRLNASAINTFIRRGANYYRAKYVDKMIEEPDSQAFVIGRMFHCILLEPDQFDKRFVVAPDVDRRTKAGKAEWEAFMQSLDGSKNVTCVTTDDCEQVFAMVDAVRGHDYASDLLNADIERICETPILFEHLGVPAKALPDIVLPKSQLIVDVKTISSAGKSIGAAASPSSFRKSVESFGYHRQARWYQLACAHAWGTEFGFLFLVVESKPPFDVACYLMSQELLSIAQKEIDEAVTDIAKRAMVNRWESEWSRGALLLHPSKYYVPYKAERGILDYE